LELNKPSAKFILSEAEWAKDDTCVSYKICVYVRLSGVEARSYNSAQSKKTLELNKPSTKFILSEAEWAQDDT
ncbi:MAG: hypothetical protein ABI576_19515, partial [Flavobacterium sp.]